MVDKMKMCDYWLLKIRFLQMSNLFDLLLMTGGRRLGGDCSSAPPSSPLPLHLHPVWGQFDTDSYNKERLQVLRWVRNKSQGLAQSLTVTVTVIVFIVLFLTQLYLT